MQPEIQEVLSSLGLSELEQKAYLALLQTGSCTATPIAGAIHAPLTTTQSVLKRLATLGYIQTSKRRSRSLYEAKDPMAIKQLLERQAQEVSNILPLLRQMQGASSKPARIRIYERERMTDIFLQALESKEKIVHEIVSAGDVQDILGERFHFTRRRVAKGVRLESLRIESKEVKKYSKASHEKEMREAKFLPRELTFRSSILFWDKTVAFFTTKDEGLAWTVESHETVLMMRQIFDLLWSISRRMETA
jgi:sugar-specific transcriptional regulator TrmB